MALLINGYLRKFYLLSVILVNGGLKVWLYLNKNKEDFEINLSPQAVLNFYKIKTDSRTSVRRGIEELFDKGYLVEEEEGLTFFQIPRNNFTK